MPVSWISATSAEPSDLCAEVVVVGSGATGQSVAKRLAASGVDVLLVEAGPAEETHRKSQRLLQAAIPAVHGQYPDFGNHLLMNLGGSIGKPQMPMSTDGSAPAEGIRLAKLTEADLTEWPISRRDLDPYYDLVSEWFGISWGAVDLPTFDDPRLVAAPFHVVSRRPFSHPTAEHLAGIRVLIDAPVSRLVTDSSGRIVGAEVSTRTGQTLTLEADTFVLAMNTMPATQLLMHSRTANSSGLLGRHLMDHPLVTFGFIEPSDNLPRSILDPLTPEPIDTGLWWPMLTPPQSMVASGDSVNVAITLVPLKWTVKRNLLRHKLLKPVVVGQRTGAKRNVDHIMQAVRDRQLKPSLAKDVMQSIRGIDELLHIKFRPAGPQFNTENGWWKQTLESGMPETFEMIAMVEQRGHYENHVSPSDEVNDLGWRKLRVNWQYSQADKDAVDRAATPIMDGLESAGFGRFTRIPAATHTENYSCHHASGTIRMSADPSEGVVDGQCRTHDHENLFVAGMSVFPTVGYANPTLTAMALGARVADTITG